MRLAENFAEANEFSLGNEYLPRYEAGEEFSAKPFGSATTKNAGVAKPMGVSADATDHSKQAPAHDADAPKWTGHSEEGTENTENAEAFAESKPLNNLKKNANTNSEANKFAELNQKETGLPSPANNSINYELRGNDIEQWIKSAKDM